jgi:broad specificity phosphatase PhoE
MTHVVLIRPGATGYDEQNRIQGVLDLPLSERGKTEVASLVDRLATRDFAGLYCGPSESTTRTAEAIARATSLRAKRLDDLRNLDQGLWQGLPVEEIKRRYTRVFRQWLDDPRTVCPPQGEPVEDALERIRTALKPILRRHRDETIGLVVAEPIAQLVAGFLRATPRLELEEDIATGSFEQIEVDVDEFKNGDAS